VCPMTVLLARKGRVRASIVAAFIALAAIPFGVAGPVAAAPDSSPVEKYVALGDSIAAGQGGGGYVDACLRSPAGYPALLDAEPKLNLLRNAACTGATIEQVAATQLAQVNRGTTLVTVTVGANGVNLPALTAACASGLTPVECAAALNAAAAYLASGDVPAQLGSLLAGTATPSPPRDRLGLRPSRWRTVAATFADVRKRGVRNAVVVEAEASTVHPVRPQRAARSRAAHVRRDLQRRPARDRGGGAHGVEEPHHRARAAG